MENTKVPVKKYTQLKNKLILSMLISVGIPFLCIFAILASASYQFTKKTTFDYTRALSEKYATVATSTLRKALDTTHLIRSAINSLQTVDPRTRRASLHDLLQRSLEESSGFFSMWVCYEPNQFDGLDATYVGTPHHDEAGRVVMYFEKDPVAMTVVENMLTDYTTSDWYLNSLSSGEEQMFEPYLSLTSSNDEILVTTFTVPLKNRKGKTVGVFGIDLTLTGLADELGSGMRNSYKYTKMYSGGEPVFTEADVFTPVIPLSEAATATVGPTEELDPREQDKEQVTIQDLIQFCSVHRSRKKMQEFMELTGRRNFSEKYIKPLKVQVEATKRFNCI